MAKTWGRPKVRNAQGSRVAFPMTSVVVVVVAAVAAGGAHVWFLVKKSCVSPFRGQVWGCHIENVSGGSSFLDGQGAAMP